jgi:hypothetical protein
VPAFPAGPSWASGRPLPGDPHLQQQQQHLKHTDFVNTLLTMTSTCCCASHAAATVKCIPRSQQGTRPACALHKYEPAVTCCCNSTLWQQPTAASTKINCSITTAAEPCVTVDHCKTLLLYYQLPKLSQAVFR